MMLGLHYHMVPNTSCRTFEDIPVFQVMNDQNCDILSQPMAWSILVEKESTTLLVILLTARPIGQIGPSPGIEQYDSHWNWSLQHWPSIPYQGNQFEEQCGEGERNTGTVL